MKFNKVALLSFIALSAPYLCSALGTTTYLSKLSEEEAADVAYLAKEEKKTGIDFMKYFDKTKNSIKAAAAIPKIISESSDLIKASTTILPTAQRYLTALKAFGEQIKTVANDQERIALTLGIVDSALIPLIQDINILLGTAAQPARTVGGKLIAPFSEKSGKQILDAATTALLFSREFNTIIDELKKTIQSRLEEAAKAITQAQKDKEAKEKATAS